MSTLFRSAAATVLGTAIALGVMACTASAQGRRTTGPPPVFRITTDDIWLNLHHFLYVLGRAEGGMPDASRRAVAGAPDDQARGLESLTAAERETWRAAVTAYAQGPSRLDPVFDEPLIEAGGILARLGSAATLEGSDLDPELRQTLEVAMPVYRKAWWPAHGAANARWLEAIDPLIARYGDEILAFVTRAYGLGWAEEGYPVRIVAYANWAGAFSTTGDLLLVASLDSGNTGLSALETIFHEAMHQWDEPVWAPLVQEAREQGRFIRRNLTHAMIFMTAGEAVRSVVDDYVPYADANGNWQRGLSAFKPALDAAWLPYLHGNGRRDEALAELVRRTGERRRAPDVGAHRGRPGQSSWVVVRPWAIIASPDALRG